jgi:hypothetical protein
MNVQQRLLFVVSGLQLLSSVLFFEHYKRRGAFSWPELSYVVSPVAYLLSGFLCGMRGSWVRYSAIGAAFLIFVSLSLYADDVASRGGDIVKDGRLIQLPSAIILLYALWVEARLESERKNLPQLTLRGLIGPTLLSLLLFTCVVFLVVAYVDAGLVALLPPAEAPRKARLDCAISVVCAYVSVACAVGLWRWRTKLWMKHKRRDPIK